MHELALAQSMLELVLRHTPADATLTRVRMRAGPMRMIDRQTMQIAWHAVVDGGPSEGVELDLTIEPWRLRCRSCGREWESEELDSACSCGGVASPLDSNTLQLTSIEVE